MPALARLHDGEIADVASYVRNAWGNSAPPVSATYVHALRQALQQEPAGRAPIQRANSAVAAPKNTRLAGTHISRSGDLLILQRRQAEARRHFRAA